MTDLLLGNPNPQMTDPVTKVQSPAEHLNQSVTHVVMRPGYDDADEVALATSTANDRMLVMIERTLPKNLKHYAIGVLEIEHLLGVHSAGDAPDWVSCPDDAEFEHALSLHFACPRGEPTALLTSVGRDMIHAQHLSTSAQPASANYMAVSANATAPSTASTTLPGEITTAGGGLLRAQATYAHTTGTTTSTLTKTFTANGSDSLPVVLAKIGVLNAASVGTLAYETLLNATSTLTISGDNVAITETCTIS